MTVLAPGMNSPITLAKTICSISQTHGKLDLIVLCLDQNGKANGDDSVALWTQPVCLGGKVVIDPLANSVCIDLPSVPGSITRFLIVVQADQGRLDDKGTLTAQIGPMDQSDVIRMSIEPGNVETLQIGEIYRHQQGWKTRCLGDGYGEGLAKLLTVHGIEISDEPSSKDQQASSATVEPQADRTPSAISFTKGEDKLPLDMRKKLSMRKQAAQKVMLTKNITKARVVIAMDCSISMKRKGIYPLIMQETVQRIAAASAALDDDGSLDAWRFGNTPNQVPTLEIQNMPSWLDLYVGMDNDLREAHSYKTKHGEKILVPHVPVGYGNDEAALIEDIRAFVKANPTKDPTLVIVFSDGGVVNNFGIEDQLKQAQSEPIFWQFVGLGSKAGYGILEKLDRMTGRAIDNVGFFAVDGIENKTDSELYELLLKEFPEWIQEAKKLGILV